MEKKKYSFWTNPEGFSIVDGLAIAFSSVYLVLAIGITFIADEFGTKIDLLRVLTQPILVILGGYFASQGIQQFTNRNNRDLDERQANRQSYQTSLYDGQDSDIEQDYNNRV